MKAIKSAMHYLFNKHLLTTNVITCGSLLGLGDCIIQNMEQLHLKTLTGQTKPYDFERTGTLFSCFYCRLAELVCPLRGEGQVMKCFLPCSQTCSIAA